MKNMCKLIIIVIVITLLVSCKPSDKYVGDWYGLSDTGQQLRINFSTEKTMTVTDDEENEEVYEINQTATGIQNSTRYFNVQVEGISHYVIFDNTKDEDNAKLYVQTNNTSEFSEVVGDLLYILNRNDYPTQ